MVLPAPLLIILPVPLLIVYVNALRFLNTRYCIRFIRDPIFDTRHVGRRDSLPGGFMFGVIPREHGSRCRMSRMTTNVTYWRAKLTPHIHHSSYFLSCTYLIGHRT